VTGKIQLVLRWSARISALALIALVLLFLIGEGPPNPFNQPLAVQLEHFGMLLMLAGFLMGWRWEAWGGMAAVGGFAVFCAAELSANGKMPGGALPFFLIPGVLFLASSGFSMLQRRKTIQ
jgi:hypothetical protein